MSAHGETLADKLAELRRAFDESFAAPAAHEDIALEDMLALEVGGGRFAVRVSELAGVHACRKMVALPGAIPGLCGVVGIRGKLVAAYRLADLIGAGVEPQGGRLRWLLLCDGG